MAQSHIAAHLKEVWCWQHLEWGGDKRHAIIDHISLSVLFGFNSSAQPDPNITGARTLRLNRRNPIWLSICPPRFAESLGAQFDLMDESLETGSCKLPQMREITNGKRHWIFFTSNILRLVFHSLWNAVMIRSSRLGLRSAWSARADSMIIRREPFASLSPRMQSVTWKSEMGYSKRRRKK